MAQHIILKISGKEYGLDVNTQEEEVLFRKAAAQVQASETELKSLCPGTSAEDIARYVAVRECYAKLNAFNDIQGLQEGIDAISSNVRAYLDKI